jgi:hypothetical protein
MCYLNTLNWQYVRATDFPIAQNGSKEIANHSKSLYWWKLQA